MGSLGASTGAIDGSKHGLNAPRGWAVRGGRNHATREFRDLVLSTADAEANNGAARGSKRV